MIRPNGFQPSREDVYAQELTTMTGKLIADLVGWKYADMTMQWDTLPEEQIKTLLDMRGENLITFDDVDGEHTEKVIRKSAVNVASRYTRDDGTAVWKDVSVEVRFINAHN